MAEVALLGTGRMGSAMARRLVEAGHQVTLWNRSPAAADAVVAGLPPGSVRAVPSAAEAVRGREVVLSVLRDGAATCAVLLDSTVTAALRSDAVVCDLGTTGVQAARRLGAALHAGGVRFVDAPVSGSVPAVLAGTLLVMAAGDPAAIEVARPILDAFARKVVRVGDVGSGQAMKLAVNLVVHNLNAALSEALVLAENSGITRESAYDVLQDSVVGAPFVAYKRPAFLEPDTPVAMSLDLVLKDLGLIIALARDLRIPTEVTAAAERVVRSACDAGFGDRDMASLSWTLTVDRPS